jgi:hypothetical protein
MQQALQRCGWHNYSLFMKKDGTLFGYFESDNSLDECIKGALGPARFHIGLSLCSCAHGAGPAVCRALIQKIKQPALFVTTPQKGFRLVGRTISLAFPPTKTPLIQQWKRRRSTLAGRRPWQSKHRGVHVQSPHGSSPRKFSSFS